MRDEKISGTGTGVEGVRGGGIVWEEFGVVIKSKYGP